MNTDPKETENEPQIELVLKHFHLTIHEIIHEQEAMKVEFLLATALFLIFLLIISLSGGSEQITIFISFSVALIGLSAAFVQQQKIFQLERVIKHNNSWHEFNSKFNILIRSYYRWIKHYAKFR